jgi:hypothetical protein
MIPPIDCDVDARALGANPSAEQVVRELRTLIGEYHELDRMSKQQAGLIRAGDADALLGLLNEREGVIARLEQHTRRLAPVRGRWGEFTESLSDAERDELRGVTDELTDIAGRIARRDESDRAALEERRGEIRREITGVTNSQRAMSAYTQGANAPNFQDRSA